MGKTAACCEEFNATGHAHTTQCRPEPPYDPMPTFAIKAQDMLAADTVRAYRDLCVHLGLLDQAREVGRALDEIVAWQVRNPDRVKIPDHQHQPAR